MTNVELVVNNISKETLSVGNEKQPNAIVTHVLGSDWEALYLNDDLYVEGHDIDLSDLAALFLENPQISEFVTACADDEWLAEREDEFPASLKDVVLSDDDQYHTMD